MLALLVLSSIVPRTVALAAEAAEPELPSLQCRTLPEAIDLLRQRGLAVAYSERLVSHRMLVHVEPDTEAAGLAGAEEVLRQILAPYELGLEQLPGGALSVTPQAGLDAAALRGLDRASRPLLRRESSYDALPEWRGAEDLGRTLLDLRFEEGSSSTLSPSLGSHLDFVIWKLPARLNNPQRAAFELKQRIVEAGSRAPQARMGLEGTAAVVNQLMSAELAPYVDGYVFGAQTANGSPRPQVPQADPTGRPWWRMRLADVESQRSVGDTKHAHSLLHHLLEGSRLGAGLVLVEDARPDDAERGLLEAVRATGAGLLSEQPKIRSSGSSSIHVFMEPQRGSYQIALSGGQDGERIRIELEPQLQARVLYPPAGGIASDSHGSWTHLQLQGNEKQGGHWLIELVTPHDLHRYSQALVEGEVIVDPYEIVVRNQIFQRAEQEKVLSLDVMEYASINPLYRDGRRAQWEHRIFHRRGRLDEYLHLKVLHDGVELPRDKMHRSVLQRPAERIELAPLELENRKTYRYRYLGQEDVDGHPTWKISFSPVVEGRLVSGVVWIDQLTGAHRKVRARHQNLGLGVLSGEYTTRYRWIPGDQGCHWDWDHRYGTETYELLDFEGAAEIDYRRERFLYNRPDIEAEIAAAHHSDVLIHVATPPHGHRWLVRGDEAEPQRGDTVYGDGWLRDGDGHGAEAVGLQQPEPALSSSGDSGSMPAIGEDTAQPAPLGNLPQGDDLSQFLAGPWAFPSRSRVRLAFFGGSDGIETDAKLGVNYRTLDFLGRGRRGKDPLYLWLGAFDDDGLIAVTDPHLFGSKWSLTTAIDLQFNPDEDFLFRQNTPSPGDESSSRNLSLDSERRAVRLSFGRPLGGTLFGGSMSLRLQLGVHGLTFTRSANTDANFVMPTDTGELTGRAELSWSRRSVNVEAGLESGYREIWEAWGLDGRQQPQRHWTRWDLRTTTSRGFGRSQSLQATLGLFEGSNLDRFSRRRLFEVDARVPGYSSSIGFDEGVHAAVAYRFRVWKLPLRLRVDAADLYYDSAPLEPELVDQSLVGAEISVELNGPWETDLLIGVGQGLHAEPERSDPTSWWLFMSRRFGPG